MDSARRGFISSDPDTREYLWKEEIRQRLETLESAQGLRNAAVKGGAVTVWNNQNDQISRFGKGQYNHAGELRDTNGIAAVSAAGVFHLLIDHEEGWLDPVLPFPFVPDTYVAVTSGSYVNTWKSLIHVFGTTIYCQFLVGVDASTTGDVKLNIAGIDSDVISCPAGVFTTCTFSWNLKDRISLADKYALRIKARRLTGTGNVNVYAPDSALSIPEFRRSDATIGGIASV